MEWWILWQAVAQYVSNTTLYVVSYTKVWCVLCFRCKGKSEKYGREREDHYFFHVATLKEARGTSLKVIGAGHYLESERKE